MGLLVWVMIGLALWHFTIFLPDHFYAGIVGAFVAAFFGSIISGLAFNAGSVPGNSEVEILTAFEAIPGAVIAMALTYWLGLRQERNDLAEEL